MKILFATDGSKYSEFAAKFLKTLHLTDNSRVYLVNVVEGFNPAGYTDIYPGILNMLEEMNKESIYTADKILNKAESLLSVSPAKMVKKSYTGHPAEEIIKASEEFDVDLIVTGSAGRTGIEELLLGGVSQKVLKYSKKSVLIIKKSFKKLDKILFASDGSTYAHKALKWIINSKLPNTANIHVLSVVPQLDNILLQESVVSKERIKAIMDVHRKAANLVVENSKKELKDRFVKVNGEVLDGDPANEIVIMSKEGKYDLVVVGAKGLSCVEAFLLGGVTRKVAKLAGSSVMIVR